MHDEEENCEGGNVPNHSIKIHRRVEIQSGPTQANKFFNLDSFGDKFIKICEDANFGGDEDQSQPGFGHTAEENPQYYLLECFERDLTGLKCET